jgi:hypothetical protein
MKLHLLVAATLVGWPLAACQTNDQLMFVSTNNLGVKVALGAETQPLTFNVGYGSYDGAMMPALARKGSDGEIKVIQGRHHYCASSDASKLDACLASADKRTERSGEGPQNGLVLSEDALSVVSSFGSDNRVTQSTNSVSSKLGKIFATGVSAQRISEGLKAELTYANSAACITAINAGGFDAATKAELIRAKC